MSAQKHSLVIIGYGGMGSYHGKLITDNQRIEVTGAFDPSEERRKAALEAGYKAYESFEEVLADQTVETVLIATPNDVHKDIAISALRAGKHVICEKPVAMNSREFEEMIAVAEETGRVLMVNQNRR